jgi:cell division protein FtsB
MPTPKNNLISRVLSFRYLIAINLVIIVLLSLSLGREVVRNYEIQSEIYQLQAQAESLAVKNSEISELYTAIQTESYIEREARLKLGMKKPGESVVVVQDAGQERVVSETEEGQVLESGGILFIEDVPREEVANVYKWWYYFFNKEQLNG